MRRLRRIPPTLLTAVLLAACGRSVEPVNARDAVARGVDALASGDTAAATRELLAAIEADPDNLLALYNLGYIAQTRGHDAAAEAHYRAVLDENPRFEGALFNLALLRTEAGGTQEAIELYRRVVDVDPDQAEAHLNLGMLLLDAPGHGKEAAAHIRTAVRLDPALIRRLEGGAVVTGPSPPATAP